MPCHPQPTTPHKESKRRVGVFGMEEKEALDAPEIERIEDRPSPLSQSQQKVRGGAKTKEEKEAEIAN